ncbi:type IV toxin-antitoxin system AbiEi family antitoxin [Mycetocola reblochoni]|uniref:type IV toxin-antitoxin system AbiEi family antitoxin n=1 Tax=Mycetocola reblochoni TaxID=331618 RepID=UPI003F960C04
MTSPRPDFPLDGFLPAELSALRNEGCLVDLAVGRYRLIDEPDCAETRARSIADGWSESARRRLVVAGASAAWIHGCTAAPPRADEVIARPEARFRPSGRARMRGSERPVDADQLWSLSSVAVLTPAATILDLALRLDTLSPVHPESLGVLRGRAEHAVALRFMYDRWMGRVGDEVDELLRRTCGARRHAELLGVLSAVAGGAVRVRSTRPALRSVDPGRAGEERSVHVATGAAGVAVTGMPTRSVA